jgi:hypothetical protein
MSHDASSNTAGVKDLALELRMVHGLHAGAALRLLPPKVTLGSDERCDVVLLDPGVQAQHLALVHDDLLGWSIESSGQGLSLNTPMPIGEAVFIVCSPEQAWLLPHEWQAMLTSAQAPVEPSWVDAVPTESAAFESAPAERKLVAGARSMSMQTRTRLVLVLLLLFLLALWWLSGWGLGVSSRPSIRAPMPSDALKYREPLNQALPRPVPEVPLADRDDRPPVPIQGIVMGPVSYVMLADGRRLYEGQSVAHWRLESIRATEVVWTGPRRIEMPW